MTAFLLIVLLIAIVAGTCWLASRDNNPYW